MKLFTGMKKQKKINLYGIFNKCCRIENMKKFDKIHLQCKTCSRLFATDSERIVRHFTPNVRKKE